MRSGGYITGSPVEPSTSAAKGIWTLDEQRYWKARSKWPATGQTLMQAITAAGLTSNLLFALDSGDGSSYLSGQSWLDTSGNGHDFFLGTTSGSEATDPTFNGSAGSRTSSEYWSSDGGDLFTYDTTNPAAFNNLHKDNATFTLFVVLWPITTQVFSLIGTGRTLAEIGIDIRLRGSDKPTIEGVNGSGTTQLLSKTTDATVTTGGWTALALSVDEAGGSVSFFWENGGYKQVSASNTFSAAYTSPSASDASRTLQIGARGDSADPMPNGGRIAQFALWSSALSKANLDSLYAEAAIKTRFGLP